MALESQNAGLAPAYARGNVNPVSPEFAQYRSEVPGGAKVTVMTPRVQMTSRSKAKAIQQTTVIATHWLNVPFQDGLFSVARIYKVVAAAALNYQMEHQDAFFEAFPQLIIKAKDEDDSKFTTAYLRTHYKVFAKRIAHYWYHYAEAMKLYTASLLNLLNMSKLNGAEPFKSIAYSFRWSVINSNSAMYSRFPKPTGCEAAMAEATKWAVGSTTYGANLYSIPIWATDLFGNRGFHTLDFAGMIGYNPTSHSSDKSPDADYLDLDESSTGEAARAKALISNMWDTLNQYSYGKKKPRSPRIENGASQTYQFNSFGGPDLDPAPIIQTKLNLDSNTVQDEKFGFDSQGISKNDNIIRPLWDSYNAWEAYILLNFSEMMDPNNDKVTVAMGQLKLFQKSSLPEDLLKVVRDNNTVSITDLAKKLTYKKDNQVTTATILKYAPLLSAKNTDSPFLPGADYYGTKFHDNFERYNVDSDSPALIVEESMKWPHITPSIFSPAAQQLEGDETSPSNQVPCFVVNGVLTTGHIVSQNFEAVEPTGKYLTLMDQVLCTNMFTEDSYFDMYGVTPEYALEWAQKDNGIVINELPLSVFAVQQPILDPTDIYQCGFNLLISADDVVGNEWTNHFTSPEYYLQCQQKSLPVKYNKGIFSGTFSIWDFPSMDEIAADTKDGVPMHIVNETYRKRIGHTLIFVGGAIMSHPWNRFTRPESGLPYLDLATLNPALNVGKAVQSFFKQLKDAAFKPTTWSSIDEVYSLWFAAGDTVNNIDTDGSKAFQGNRLDLDIANTIGGINTDTDIESKAKIVQFLFDPAYGAVQPIVDALPLGAYAASDVMAVTESEGPAGVSYYPDNTFAAVTPIMGVNIVRQTSDASASDDIFGSLLPACYSKMTDAAKYYIYYLRKFGFRPVSINPITHQVRGADSVAGFHFESGSKWPLTLTAISHVAFPGIEDMRNFWDVVKDFAPNVEVKFDVAAEGDVPHDNTMIAPKQAPRSTEQTKPFTGNGGSQTTHESSSNAAERSMGVSSSSGGDRSGSRGRGKSIKKGKSSSFRGNSKSARPELRRERNVSSKDFDDNRNPYAVTPGNPATVSTAGVANSGSDYSSDKTDSKFAKGKRRVLDGVSVQQG